MNKENKKAKWIKRLGYMFLFATFAFLVLCWIVGSRLVAPANQHVGQPPEELNFVSTTVKSESGSALATWYADAANAKATVVLLHPLHADRRAMLDRARMFLKHDFSVVLMDFQAHGESDGDNLTIGHLEKFDVQAIAKFAGGRNPEHSLMIDGWSLGGAAAVLAGPIEGVDAIVLESVYPTIEEAIDDRVAMRLGPLSKIVSPLLTVQLPIRLGISPTELRPIEAIKNVDCPILMLVGDQDQHTPLDESQRLFESANSPKKLVVFKGAEHTDLFAFDPKLFESSVLTFFDEHLRK